MSYRSILRSFPFLDWKYQGVSVVSLCVFGVVTIAVFFGLRWLRRLIIARLESFAARTATALDDLMLGLVRHTNLVFLLVVSLYAGSLALRLPMEQRQASAWS